MGYRLEADFAFHRTTPDELSLNEFLERVDIHLVDKLGAKDVAIISDSSDETFTIALAAVGSTEAEAFGAALSTLRTAFHAEECATPDWPTWTEYKNAGLVKRDRVSPKEFAPAS